MHDTLYKTDKNRQFKNKQSKLLFELQTLCHIILFGRCFSNCLPPFYTSVNNTHKPKHQLLNEVMSCILKAFFVYNCAKGTVRWRRHAEETLTTTATRSTGLYCFLVHKLQKVQKVLLLICANLCNEKEQHTPLSIYASLWEKSQHISD